MVKLKYVVKLLPIYGQSQIYGQILYVQTQIHGQTKVMVISPIYGQTCRKYMVKILRKSPYIIVKDMTYLLVNWTDVTSTESAFDVRE